ncbi:hypothetical protein [Porphyromonas cangingivalis]|uniref:hypothetical protein n=1 Tax=Porphyromonas cangingivalis TaxID=36874 RepID=UPI000AE7C8C3|nr:hypothetical protein [Porphyromonas cangingivalis]
MFAFSLSSFEKLNPEESQEGFKKYMSIGEVKEGRRKDILRLLGSTSVTLHHSYGCVTRDSRSSSKMERVSRSRPKRYGARSHI